MVEEPKIGFRFNVSGDNPISTSGVQEVLENNTFKTWSSIYKIEYLND